VLQVQQVQRARLDLNGLKVLELLQELWAIMEIFILIETLAITMKKLLVAGSYKATSKVPLVLQDKQDQQERRDKLDQQDQQVSREQQDRKDKRVKRDQQV
jgi:hypothetical protein